jgi:hypothetical protein
MAVLMETRRRVAQNLASKQRRFGHGYKLLHKRLLVDFEKRLAKVPAKPSE